MAETRLRVLCYSPDDEKLFAYMFTEEELQETVKAFHREIWFTVTDEELSLYLEIEDPVSDNLKNDFIWFKPGVNRRSIMQCTCNGFLESDESNEAGLDRLAKKALRHHKKTGHQLNPKGN